MRGAYGKPNGLAARVTINQIMFSIRTTLKGEEHAVEALRKVMSPASSLPPGTYVSVSLVRLSFSGAKRAQGADGAACMIRCAAHASRYKSFWQLVPLATAATSSSHWFTMRARCGCCRRWAVLLGPAGVQGLGFSVVGTCWSSLYCGGRAHVCCCCLMMV